MKIKIVNLERRLKLKFLNKSFLTKSLTHKGYDPNENNEKILNEASVIKTPKKRSYTNGNPGQIRSRRCTSHAASRRAS